MAITMNNNQETTATIPPITDAAGRPAQIDPTEGIVWTASDATKVIIEPSSDGMTALIKAAGPAGSVTILARGDADLDTGEGEQSFIFWTGDISINALQAVGGELGFSAPVDQ